MDLMGTDPLFCIKKNATSAMNPWLMQAPQYGNQLIYGKLQDLVKGTGKLVAFKTPEETQEYIRKHPEMCDERCLVCKVTFDNGSITIEPLTAPAKPNAQTSVEARCNPSA